MKDFHEKRTRLLQMPHWMLLLSSNVSRLNADFLRFKIERTKWGITVGFRDARMKPRQEFLNCTRY
jgi:hypothetical protein